MKNKGGIIFGIFVIALIIAFAIYKALGTTNVTVQSSGGSQTNSTNGIGNLIGSITGLGGAGGILNSIKGWFSRDSGSTSGGSYEDNTYEG